MPSFSKSFVYALLISLVLAVPAPIPSHQRKGRSFKVQRIRNANFGGHDGTTALLKTYRKWGMELPSGLDESISLAKRARVGGGVAGINPALVGALALNVGDTAGDDLNSDAAVTVTRTRTVIASVPTTAASTSAVSSNSPANGSNGGGAGEVAATPEGGDVEFLAPVQVGGQTLNLDFDTGSSDLWVFNTQLPQSSQAGHMNFDPEKSTTFQPLEGATFSISYGDGSTASGNVGTDTVNIGGALVTSQAIELATAVSGGFLRDKNSNGLVGLAFGTLNTVRPAKQKTFFENAIPTLAEPVFTANLKKGTAGSYEFGAIDATQFNGPLSWVPIDNSNGFWEFSSTKFSVNNGPVITTPGGTAIADTGTTLMVVDKAIVNAYYSQVNGAVNDASVGGIVFPCSSDLPDLQVDIGGNYMASIPGSVINFAPVDPSGQTCFGGLQVTTQPFQIYGDIFFKAQFVAFNGGNNSIGIAPHN